MKIIYSFFLNSHFTLHQTMKSFIIFSFLMVTLLARNRKHYLVEVEDKNEIIDENEKNHKKDEENVFNHEELNTDEEKKVLY